MSNRFYRKLCTANAAHVDCGAAPIPSNVEEESEEVAAGGMRKQNRNLFDMLMLEDGEADEQQLVEDDAGNENAATCTGMVTSSRTKKKKKKKNRAAAPIGHENDIDACVEEVHRLLDQQQQQVTKSYVDATNADSFLSKRNRSSLLAVDHRFLQPERELRRLFGTRVVQEQQRRQHDVRGARGRVRGQLVQPRPEWPPTVRLGLQMRPIDATAIEENGSCSNGRYFVIEHSREYQRTQMLFYHAVDSLNPDNIRAVLHQQPYHVDALLQFSDIFRAQEDAEAAADLLMRCIHGFECAFHPTFSLAAGDCRLDYCQQENRGFFVALFRYIGHLASRGCYRTALEFGKALLSLQPEEDPLCVLLMIDFFAVMAGEYAFFLQLYSDLEPSRHVSQLPNFAFSLPLCRRRRALAFGTSNSQEAASEMSLADGELQTALLRFPSLLLPLLDKCGVQPDMEVKSAALFNDQCSSGLLQLQRLYVVRCHSFWKEPDTLTWLESTTRQLLQQIQQPEIGLVLSEMEEHRRTRYHRAPLNVLRHLWLSELTDAPVELPAQLATQQILSYDPLPPEDSRNTYSRPMRRPLRLANNSNTFTNFLRSFLPNFDPEALADQHASSNEGTIVEGLLSSLTAAVRDFLRDVRPAAEYEGPLENDEFEAEGH